MGLQYIIVKSNLSTIYISKITNIYIQDRFGTPVNNFLFYKYDNYVYLQWYINDYFLPHLWNYIMTGGWLYTNIHQQICGYENWMDYNY